MGGDGVLLVAGEAFVWRPWEGFGLNKDGGGEDAKRRMVNKKGQWEVEEQVWGLLGLVWPRPGKFYTLSHSSKSNAFHNFFLFVCY